MIPAGIAKLIHKAVSQKAADIHICAGAPIMFRMGKDLMPSTSGNVTPELAERMARELLTPEQFAVLKEQFDYDLMVSDEHGRYRINASICDQSVSLVIRILPEESKSLDDLKLPSVIKYLANQTKGLVLITGSTSQGKTSTMSGIINEINTHQRRHVITIEDPIESMHVSKLSLIRQREVGRDTKTFYSGLRAALRQDPDVIAIGEMRDYETIKIALTAAETGVLVLSTLHIISIDKLIERLLSYAPSDDEGHMRYLLADAIQGVVHQELLPTTTGGKRVACEVLVSNDAVRNVIRRRDSFLLRNIIHTGGKFGMVSMKQSITELLDEGAISPEVAEAVMVNY